MGDYDVSANIGQAAGLGKPSTKDPVTPDQLVARFCGDGATGLVPDPGVCGVDGVRTGSGWCGYCGGRGDSMIVGFDDGYDFMGYLCDRGWRALPAKGDWPYVVYLVYIGKEGENIFAIAEYVEADLVVTILPTKEQLGEFYRTLREAP